MEVNTNMNVSGVNGVIPPGRAAAAARMAQDTASFSGSAGVESALNALPESRPDAVVLARQLINDPSYPSADVVKQMAQFLAPMLASGND